MLEVAQHDAGLLGERGLHEHLVAAQVDDVVDVLDVDRALLDARPAGGARPQHVGIDDAVGAVGADQRPLRRRPAWVRPATLGIRARSRPGASRYGALANEWSRRLMMSSLGESGLPVFHAGHCSGSGRTRCRCAKSSRPFQVKSSTLPTAHEVVLARVLEVDRTAGGVDRQQRAERTRAAGERDVDDGRHDVQVLAVHNEHEESQDDADRDQDRDGLEGLVGLLTQRR